MGYGVQHLEYVERVQRFEIAVGTDEHDHCEPDAVVAGSNPVPPIDPDGVRSHYEPGRYRVHIRVRCENAATKDVRLVIRVRGDREPFELHQA